jgi:hypothetical protein
MSSDPYVAAQLIIYRSALNYLSGSVEDVTLDGVGDVNHIINSARIDVLRFDCPEAQADQRLQKGAEVLSTLRAVGADDVARASELARLAGAALDEVLEPAEIVLGRKTLRLDRQISAYADHNIPGHLPPAARRAALVSLVASSDVGEAEIATALAATGLRLLGRPEPAIEL